MNLQSIRARVRQQFSKHTDPTILPEPSGYITERRCSQRSEVETLVTAITKTGVRLQGYCRNLSREGTAAIIWGEMEVGEEICLAFRSLGSEQETIIPAIVKNSISHRYGFEFTVEDQTQLHNLMKETCRIEATYS
jgi:hypothetical protein